MYLPGTHENYFSFIRQLISRYDGTINNTLGGHNDKISKEVEGAGPKKDRTDGTINNTTGVQKDTTNTEVEGARLVKIL